MSTALENTITQILNNQGFDDFAFIPLIEPLSFKQYSQWLDQGFHGDMTYMNEAKEVRKKPMDHFKKVQSMIVFRTPYFPHPESESYPFNHLKVAHYARGKDYHFWFREKLNQLIVELKNLYPNEEFLSYTDSVPLLERDHAFQGGLGWVGKNTCLIDRKAGSLFFIGEILTSLKSESSPETVPDHCGTCTACLDACPTQAFEEPKVLNAEKCIAYWNIESKSVPPESMRKSMGDWLFGCDICQTVCPWNIKLHKMDPQFELPEPSEEDLCEELLKILTSSNKQLMRELAQTPLTRAGGRGLKRNAMIVIANKKLKDLSDEVARFKDHESLGELARWTLDQLNL
ncbi:MAG: tRNA epoxyqueuosine(34) reductase QueG [Bdellovibrionales bacterium]|nr:tRNA epoxyqueuosine(34) reductase QueG [Bdellovibrionales bacterium]NQZ19102.1 tRNA epoxyqueuosine(34) reductase QueG [Bdellovibrionales bacterium]